MLNTGAWPEVQLSVLTEIQLDPKNVRLETSTPQVEADIIEDLFANEDALGLVEAISKVGYLTHETPIVVKRRGKYVVVEGNRRIAALKAIQNPMLVPKYQARVTAIAKSIPNVRLLATVRVMVAPNQSVADQLIAAIHTGNLRRPWSPARQAAFFQAQIDAGRSFAELVQRYPTIDVRYFVFRSHIVNIFREAKYADPSLKDFLNTKEWRRGLSTLSRIYESKEFLELTGLQMDLKGTITKSISDKQLNAVLAIVVEGIRDGSLNTRSLNTVRSPRFIGLMTEVRDAAALSTPPAATPAPAPASGQPVPATPAPSPGTTPSPTSPATPSPRGTPPAAKLAATKKKTQWLPVGHLVVPSAYPVAVSLHLQELSATDIQRFPNATFLMLRAILEKSIKAFAEAKGLNIKASGNNTNGYVQLHDALKWYSAHIAQNGPRALVQPLAQLRNGKLVNYTSSKDALDAINHNHHFHVDPDEVINCWNSIDSILRELMKP